jgi:hypothetical protein
VQPHDQQQHQHRITGTLEREAAVVAPPKTFRRVHWLESLGKSAISTRIENVRLVVDPATGMPNNLGELMVRSLLLLVLVGHAEDGSVDR